MTVSEVFTKNVYRIPAPLVFLIFVTNRRFSTRAPLDDFRKGRISKSDAIIFSGVCNKQGVLRFVPLSDFYKSSISVICNIRLFHRIRNIKLCDIKYGHQSTIRGAFAEEKPRLAIINMPALVKSMQRRQGMKMVFSTRHADAVSF